MRTTHGAALALLASCLLLHGAALEAGDAAARPPAPSLTAPRGGALPVDARGFIRRWLVLEPIVVRGQLTESAVNAAVQAAMLPGSLTALPRAGDIVSRDVAVAWRAFDTRLYNFNLYHFAWALSKPTSNVLFWVTTTVESPREMADVRLAIGSNAASLWWLNGEQVISIYGDRQSVIDDGVSKRLVLHKGRNVIRAAIINGGGATDFCARLLDSNDQPITGLTVSVAQPSN